MDREKFLCVQEKRIINYISAHRLRNAGYIHSGKRYNSGKRIPILLNLVF